MYPRLLELGPITVYTYGVLLAAAYLLGLKLAMVRAQARNLDHTRVLDLGMYIIISGRRGADSHHPARHRVTGPPFCRAHVLAVHAALRHLPLHRRDLPRRPARQRRDLLDVAVHLGAPGAARDRDARLSVPGPRAGA